MEASKAPKKRQNLSNNEKLVLLEKYDSLLPVKMCSCHIELSFNSNSTDIQASWKSPVGSFIQPRDSEGAEECQAGNTAGFFC